MLTGALATFAAQALPESAHRLLASSGMTSISISGNASTAGVAAEQDRVRQSVRAAFGGVRYRLDSAIWSDPLGLPAARGARNIPIAEAASLDQVRAHATLVAGSWPAAGTGGGSSLTLRSAALAVLTSASLPRGAFAIYAEGVLAAAALAVLILLITMVLGAQTRELTLARLATMGLSRSQARWLLVAEAMPLILVAAAGGVGCAATLAPLIGPSINLSPFTGSPIPVLITAQPAALTIAAACLIALALLTMIIQTRLARRRGVTSRALRLGQ